ncbi:hypothetical protein N799_05180 [Lysobacter arseniciresistens ZS79]|uniref:Uncharacterized protein n=1 Tax=Lysobacter arseniciresistens ZS79 TaxID=913325 RepID=A0A0A0F7X8_9GAMM|nr:hypothetical protein [Lysobacter arseniciresistens]KGM57467.1 hypothetical protein N799_05180 [Lysobacter arseniciresistens ZS79]
MRVKRKKLTKKQKAFLAVHALGLRQTDMAKRLGVSRQRIHQFYVHFGLEPTTAQEIFQHRMDELARLVGEGLTNQEIGKRMDMELGQVGHYRRVIGLPITKEIKARRERVRQLLEKGLNAKEVASELDLTYATVLADKTRLGLSPLVHQRAIEGAKRRKKVKKLYFTDAKSVEQIAEFLRVKPSLVTQDLSVLDHRKAGLSEKKIGEIRDLVLQGAGNTEVVARTGCTMTQVCVVIQRMKDDKELPPGRRPCRKFKNSRA